MTMPLVMLGPGGDFVTRYETQGRNLYRIDSPMQQQPDTETAGSFAGYSRMPRRKGKGGAGQDGQGVSVGPEGPITIERGTDVFEHMPATPATGTYAPQTGRPAAEAADRHDALLQAAATLLSVQQQSLRQLQALTRVPDAAAQNPASQPTPAAPVSSRKTNFVPVTAWSAGRPASSNLNRALSPVALAAARAAALTPTSAQSETDHEPHAQTTAHSHPHPRPALGSRLLADHAGTGRRTGRQQGYGFRARRNLDQKGRVVAPAQQGTLFGT